MRTRFLLYLAALGAFAASSAAHAATPGDPFERMNRFFYGGSTAADRHLFLPLARLYSRLTPGLIGQSIHNFIVNIGEPVVVANDMLQARFRRATDDVARFVTNSTIGLGGVVDVAASQGLPYKENDFGITLGRWGVGPGPYLFLPLLGPSDVRDAIGAGADAVMTPLAWVRFHGRTSLGVTVGVLGVLDQRERAEPQLKALLSGAADPYATLRSVYLQQREAEIRGEQATPVLPSLDEGAADAPAGATMAGAPLLIPPPPVGASPGSADAPEAGADPAGAEISPRDAPIATARPCDLGAPMRLAEGG